MSKEVNFRVAVRSPRRTFQALRAEHRECVAVLDATVTKALKRQGVELHPCPASVQDGMGYPVSRLGHIYYHAAIKGKDLGARHALERERAKREDGHRAV